MSKKKKRKEDGAEQSGYVTELKGILLVLIAIIGLCPFGIVAEFIKGFACFLFGTLWALFLVFIGVVGIYTIVKRKYPKLLTGKTLGIIIILIGVLTLLHINYIKANEINPNKFNFLNDSITILKSTVDNVMRSIKESIWCIETGGGVIGAIFISIFTTLLTLNGAKFICIALIICGLMIYTGVSLYEFFKKTSNEVKKVASKVHMPKREKKERVEEEKEKTVEVEPEVEEKEVTVVTSTDTGEVINKQYKFPPICLLNKSTKTDGRENEMAIKNNIPILIQTLKDFGIEAHVVDTHVGPAVTQYELEIKAGTKVSKILSLNREIALALAAKDVRIQAPIPGKNTIGIELPNKNISMVSVREVLTSVPQSKANSKLLAVLGRDIMGNPQWMEINKTPHLLVAGSTGSGKSVCINSILASILMRSKPDEVKLLLVDPKKVELSIYNGVPHLLAPVVTDPKRANIALKRIVAEMERRYDVFEESRTKNIESYNEHIDKKNEGLPENQKEKHMPFIVVIIDELADLMLVAAKEVEDSIMRITQMARAAGIHLIVATQRPSTDVITGVVKANIPSRISFAVSSGIDSRTILDMVGAEKLLGKGDMLFLPQGTNAPLRIQGTFISEDETKAIVDYVCNQQKAHYDETILMDDEEKGATTMLDSKDDYEEPLYNEIVDFVIEQGKASASLLQRRFRLGYNRAARCIDLLEERGIVGPQNGSKPREVLVKSNTEDD